MKLPSLYKQFVLYGLGIGGPAVLTAATTAIFTRLLTTDSYGGFAVAFAAVNLAVAFFGQWIIQPLGRFMPGAQKEEAGLVFKVGISTAFITAFALGLCILIAGLFFGLPEKYAPYLLPSYLLLISQMLLACTTVAIQANQRADLYASQQIVLSIARGAITISLLFLIGKIGGVLMWGVALATLLVFPWSFIRVSRLLEVDASLSLAKAAPVFRKMAAYGLPMLIWFAAISFLSQGDKIIIGFSTTASDAGIYSANYSLMNGTVGLITAPILAGTWPMLMRAWQQDDKVSAASWLGKIASAVTAGGFLLVGAVYALSSKIAETFLGSGFREGHSVMPIVVAGMVALAVASYANKPFEFTQRLKPMIFLAIGAAFFSGILNFSLIPIYGYKCAAWISLSSSLLYALASIVLGRKVLDWSWRAEPIILAVCGVAIGVACVRLFQNYFDYPALIALCLGGVVYVAGALTPFLAKKLATKLLRKDFA